MIFRPAAMMSLAAALSLPALAEEPIVKTAPTPPPAAGPTVAAAQAFCGDATAKADELIARYSGDAKLKQVHKSVDYLAFADDEKNATVMYTFTMAGHAAHPAAVCRRVVKEGDAATIKMEVVCEGAAEACDKLRNDFNVLTARMQAEVDQKIAAEKK